MKGLQIVGPLVFALLGLFVVKRVVLAQSVPPPVLQLKTLTNNQVQLSISNGVNFTSYEVRGWQALDPGSPLIWYAVGTNGQTNFVLDRGPSPLGFFRVTTNTNWDGDAFPNWMDANPSNAAIGILTITIQTPANGTTIQ